MNLGNSQHHCDKKDAGIIRLFCLVVDVTNGVFFIFRQWLICEQNFVEHKPCKTSHFHSIFTYKSVKLVFVFLGQTKITSNAAKNVQPREFYQTLLKLCKKVSHLYRRLFPFPLNYISVSRSCFFSLFSIILFSCSNVHSTSILQQQCYELPFFQPVFDWWW